MYFFDFEDYCYNQSIGTNSRNIFTTALGTICENNAETFRSQRDAMRQSVSEWYNLSNPYISSYGFGGGTLTWPATTAGYTQYTGGFTGGFDDGFTASAILLPTRFKMNNVESTNLYVGTNGYFSIGAGSFARSSQPFNSGGVAVLCGNLGDNYLQPGLAMPVDNTIQNIWYQTGSDGGGRFYVKLLIYAGRWSDITTPTTWYAGFYRDTQSQWLEVMVKPTSTIQGPTSAGPYNPTLVAQQPSTSTKVWQSDLNGENWVYRGTGVVNSTAPMSPTPRLCPSCDTYYNEYMSLTAPTGPISNFWNDAVNNFANTTQANFTTYVQNVYHEKCVLKELLSCVDGDTFPAFIV